MIPLYTGIGGVRKEITEMSCGISGVKRDMSEMWAGIGGVKRQIFKKVSYDPVFANNTWETIIAACQNREVPDTWVADGTCYKDMTISDTNFRIDIIGKNHDTYTDGSVAPLTFQMHDNFFNQLQMNSSSSNTGGWESCLMRNSTLPTLLNLMPSEVKNAIKVVQKKTSVGAMGGTIKITGDKLFLLSEIEVRGSVANSFAGEGSQYEYYKSQTNIKSVSGTPWMWWLRSPYKASQTQFCVVTISGTYSFWVANSSQGVSFAFCF